eukprot:4741-Heterococcus_DN1.PRE.6
MQANLEHVCDVRCTQVIVSLILQVQVQEGKKVNLPAAVALDVPELNAIALRVHIDAVSKYDDSSSSMRVSLLASACSTLVACIAT